MGSSGSDHYLLISSDMHGGADLLAYRPYLDTKWQDEFDEWARTFENPFDRFGEVLDNATSLNWDSDARTAYLDDQGIAGEVIFPNTVPPFCKVGAGLALNPPRNKSDFAYAWAGLEAHNRWLVDFCGLVPSRRRGLIQILPNDVEVAVSGIERAKAADRLGVIGGILLPAVPPGFEGDIEPYFHPKYEPIWSVCEDLELPIHQHPGTGTPTNGVGAPINAVMQSLEIGTWTRRTMIHLIASGVFERHPQLKAVWTEQYCLGTFLEDLLMMDLRVPGYQSANKGNPAIADFTFLGCDVIDSLKRKPSEYFSTNCYLGASLLRRADVLRRYEFGVDRIMWGVDFPHQEGSGSHTLDAMRKLFWDIPEDECRQMVGGVALDVYHFDETSLQKISDRIGPAVSDVMRSFDGAPVPSSGFAFS